MKFRPLYRLPKPRYRPRAAAPQAIPPDVMAGYYGMPRVQPPAGVVPRLSLIELGGGYDLTVIDAWCDIHGYPHPTVTAQSVDGATNDYTGDPNSADVEVHLDIGNAIGAAYRATGGPADIIVLFCPNSSAGFIAGMAAAGDLGRPCGISWGGPEDRQADMIAQGDAAMKAGNANGASYCCAAGDAGSGDGESGDHADYPGSSPYALCLGGTSIVVQGGAIVTETPWNDTATSGDGATGGGYSALEGVPAWQAGFVPTGKLRGVPDLAAAADPDSCPWDVPGFGGVGGTSAVAPFMAAFLAVCRAMGWAGGQPCPTLYAHEPDGFRDIVSGNDGDFSATKGWDPASGLGAPRLDVLYAVLTGSAAPPSPPVAPPPVTSPPVVPPPVVVTGPTLATAQKACVAALRAQRRVFGEISETRAESAVAGALAALPGWPG